MHMNVLLIYMSICHVYPGNGEVDGCEPSCGCLESNPGLLQEQELLTVELSLQSLFMTFNSSQL